MSPPRGVGGASLYGPGGGSGADIWAERFFELSLAVDALKAGAGVLTVVKAVATAAVAIGGLPVIDGYQTMDADVVLLTAQASASQNGLWVTFASGWERPGDFTDDDVITSRTVVANAGTTTSGTIWALDATPPVVVGTSPQVWVNTPVAGLTAALAALQAADALRIPLAQKGAANGVATLGADSKIPSAQLPALAIGETFPVASQAAMLALTAQRGDVAVRTDLTPDGFFLLTTDSPSTLADWVQITAAGGVFSVDGLTGAVDLSGIYAPIAEVTTRAADDAALDVRVDALEAGGGYDPNATTVLEFSGGVSCHVNHGPFWPLDKNLGHFHYDVWAAFLAEGYLISDGPGGGHGLLWGPLGTTLLKITGNIWPATRSIATKSLTSNVVTLVTALPHGITSGHVTVSGEGAPFDGTYAVASTPDATTVTYARTAANVAPTAGAGSLFDGTELLTTFGSDDGVEPGEWAVHSVARDGTSIYVYLEGILTGITPYTRVRQAGYGQLFVMGSDHQNAAGRLHSLRGFEDAFPLGANPRLGFIPQKFLSNYAYNGDRAAVLADYTKPGPIIPDLSDGYDGVLHPGTVYASAYVPSRGDTDSGLGGGEPVGPGRPTWVIDPTAPFDAAGQVVSTGYIPASPTVPVGAKIWDPFDRAKETWLTRRYSAITTLALTSNVATVTTEAAHGLVAGDTVRVQSNNGIFNGDFVVTGAPTATDFTFALIHANVAPFAASGVIASYRGLGLTVGGSLGPLRWQYSSTVFGQSRWGILNGRAVFLFGTGQTRATAWVDTGSATQDVRVTRGVGAYGMTDTGLSLRQQDTDHHYVIATYGGITTATAVVRKNTGGTLTDLGTFACPATEWTKLRGTFSGTTLTVYVDDGAGGWTQIGQITGLTDYSTATSAGIAAGFGDEITQAARYDNFTVMP